MAFSSNRRAANSSSKRSRKTVPVQRKKLPPASLKFQCTDGAMFLTLVIAVFLCVAESSPIPSRQGLTRLEKRNIIELKEGPGQCPFEGMIYYDASEGACAPCVSFCNDPFPVSCDQCSSGCSCPSGKVVDLALKACVTPDQCPVATVQDCKVMNNKEIKNGAEESFFFNSSCHTCACIEGRSLCTSERCDPLPCLESEQVFLPGACCPVCPIIEVEPIHQVELECQVETKDGVVHLLNGATYNQPCSSCFCDSGVLRCIYTTCPETVCQFGEELVTPQGECCPKCVQPSPLPALCVLDGGQVMVEGETKQQEGDPCTTCTCMSDGSVQCFAQGCTVSCPLGEEPVRQDGQCCPTCQKTKSP